MLNLLGLVCFRLVSQAWSPTYILISTSHGIINVNGYMTCKTLPGSPFPKFQDKNILMGGEGEGENEEKSDVLLHERLTIDDSLALQHLVINQFLNSNDKYSPVYMGS